MDRSHGQGLGRRVSEATAEQLAGMIQTDAAINPGNSGGPLIDTQGRVIGINTAAIRPQVGIGLGFAVPINDANDIVQQLLTTGRIVRAYMGVTYEPITNQLRAVYRLPAQQGLIVMRVDPQSPAGRAGLTVGDIIVQVDGVDITQDADFQRVFRAKVPGDPLTVQYLRNGGSHSVTLQLAGAVLD
jgi:S1-C subfamily serine protease